MEINFPTRYVEHSLQYRESIVDRYAEKLKKYALEQLMPYVRTNSIFEKIGENPLGCWEHHRVGEITGNLYAITRILKLTSSLIDEDGQLTSKHFCANYLWEMSKQYERYNNNKSMARPLEFCLGVKVHTEEGDMYFLVGEDLTNNGKDKLSSARPGDSTGLVNGKEIMYDPVEVDTQLEIYKEMEETLDLDRVVSTYLNTDNLIVLD